MEFYISHPTLLLSKFSQFRFLKSFYLIKKESFKYLDTCTLKLASKNFYPFLFEQYFYKKGVSATNCVLPNQWRFCWFPYKRSTQWENLILTFNLIILKNQQNRHKRNGVSVVSKFAYKLCILLPQYTKKKKKSMKKEKVTKSPSLGLTFLQCK